MGKSYLRYVPSASFGVIASVGSNAVYDQTGKLAFCPALERVNLWHLKQGTLVASYVGDAEVTAMARHDDILAVGYADGVVKIWRGGECAVTLQGHRGAVTVLKWDRRGSWLISGGKDTDVIVWDVVAETGLFRLRGHKDQITDLALLYRSQEEPAFLISSSKDTLVKFWDLTTQHCVETVVGHRSEVWSLALACQQRYLITGTSDMELRVWSIDLDTLDTKMTAAATANEDGDAVLMDTEKAPETKSAVTPLGTLNRSSKDRVVQLSVHPSERFFACQSSDRILEVFRIRTEDEVKRKLQRRKKKQQSDAEVVLTAGDQFTSLRVIRASAKIRSFDFSPAPMKDDQLVLMAALVNNSVEVYSVADKTTDPVLMSTLDQQGHRQDIRTMAMSSEDDILLTAGNATIKVWNVRTQQCMRTLPTNSTYAVSSAFLPGNRHVVVGTKTGQLELYDTWSSTLLESIQAHDGAVWSIDVRSDKGGLTTGGADKEIKFWDFGAIEDPNYSTTTRRLTLLHMRTLKMTDEVLCVKHSPDGKLIAVSLLDSTVKVFYNDTLKFFLSLYGHKLPVMSMDISSDNTLLVTGSADKNIKLWGLDFGDCHKSIFAHQDSVMQVRFVPQTHYFFSCSKDRTIKYWDGDKFEQIMKLDGHHGEIWSMCVSRWGQFFVTAGHDRSIRVWEKTDEQLFLEEERERELEDSYEQELVDAHDRDNDDDEVGAASKKTVESLKAGERIMEALGMFEQEQEQWTVYRKSGLKMSEPELNPLLKALGHTSPEQHVLKTLEKIKSAELDEALLVLPFSQVLLLLRALSFWVQNGWNTALCCRILVFLLKIHHRQITANRSDTDVNLRTLLDKIRADLRSGMQRQKDQIGYNIAAMRLVRRQWEQEHVSEFIDWEQEIAAKSGQIQTGKKPKAVKTIVKPTITA